MTPTMWLTIAMFCLSTILAIIAWFLRQTYHQLVTRADQQAKEHDDLRREFQAFKERLPMEYVLRDDWIRATVNLENKMDRLHDLVVKALAKLGVGG